VLIEVDGLIKTFHDRHREPVRAVDDVSFCVERGETVGLVGESGCGKSTIGRCLLRLYQPDAGTITFDGTRIERLDQGKLRRLRPRMQMVFQDPAGSTNPAFTVRQTLMDVLRHLPLPRADRAARLGSLLTSVGLDERFLDRRPDELSGGQLQRVAIARALATEPDFVFLDEPTSALDLSVRGQIVNLLADLQAERGLSYLFASHDLGVVRFLAHRVLVMYLGRIVEAGPTEEILGAPKHPYTQELVLSAGLGANTGSQHKLPGEEPSRRESPGRGTALPGCRYADRCPLVHDHCWQSEPALLRVSDDHSARCWLQTEQRRAPLLDDSHSGTETPSA
jgi:oligopeptide/dipeptide ABC transporter ATP-binding protein